MYFVGNSGGDVCAYLDDAGQRRAAARAPQTPGETRFGVRGHV